MQVKHAIILLGALSLAGGAIGLGIGYIAGKVMPGYYRNMPDPWDMSPPRTAPPVVVAMTLGGVQGAGVGLLVALILVGLFVWKRGNTDLQETVDDLCRDLRELRHTVDRLERERQHRVSAPLPVVAPELLKAETIRPNRGTDVPRSPG
jgi:hypothetical protein